MTRPPDSFRHWVKYDWEAGLLPASPQFFFRYLRTISGNKVCARCAAQNRAEQRSATMILNRHRGEMCIPRLLQQPAHEIDSGMIDCDHLCACIPPNLHPHTTWFQTNVFQYTTRSIHRKISKISLILKFNLQR